MIKLEPYELQRLQDIEFRLKQEQMTMIHGLDCEFLLRLIERLLKGN